MDIENELTYFIISCTTLGSCDNWKLTLRASAVEEVDPEGNPGNTLGNIGAETRKHTSQW